MKKVQSGTSGTSVKVANDIPTHDTLRLPKNTSGYRYIRKRISEIPVDPANGYVTRIPYT